MVIKYFFQLPKKNTFLHFEKASKKLFICNNQSSFCHQEMNNMIGWIDPDMSPNINCFFKGRNCLNQFYDFSPNNNFCKIWDPRKCDGDIQFSLREEIIDLSISRYTV